MNDEVTQVGELQDALASELATLSAEIEDLRAELSPLQQRRSAYGLLTTAAEKLAADCGAMRAAAGELSAALLRDRRLLTGAHIKVQRIVSDLKTIEYARTRREIGAALSDILVDLSQVGGLEVGLRNAKRLKEARALSRKIRRMTPKVLMIMFGSGGRD